MASGLVVGEEVTDFLSQMMPCYFVRLVQSS